MHNMSLNYFVPYYTELTEAKILEYVLTERAN